MKLNKMLITPSVGHRLQQMNVTTAKKDAAASWRVQGALSVPFNSLGGAAICFPPSPSSQF